MLATTPSSRDHLGVPLVLGGLAALGLAQLTPAYKTPLYSLAAGLGIWGVWTIWRDNQSSGGLLGAAADTMVGEVPAETSTSITPPKKMKPKAGDPVLARTIPFTGGIVNVASGGTVQRLAFRRSYELVVQLTNNTSSRVTDRLAVDSIESLYPFGEERFHYLTDPLSLAPGESLEIAISMQTAASVFRSAAAIVEVHFAGHWLQTLGFNVE